MNNSEIKLPDCPVPILQNEWEFKQLLKIYKDLRPENVLEIGSFYGGSLWHWANNGSLTAKIVSVDLPIPAIDPRYAQYLKCKQLWESWNVKSITGNSTNGAIRKAVHHEFPDINVDFCFIDGGHDKETVRSDYFVYKTFVRPGGVIAMHDVIGIPSVKVVWEEVKKNHKYIEIYNPKKGWGIGVLYI